MSHTWKHPKLGDFEHDPDRGCWVGTYDLPAFKVFTWEVDADETPGKYELMFGSEDGTNPSEAAASLASVVVANHKKLVSLVTHALWEEFNGRGPKNIIWWYGDMDQVEENFGYGDLPRPTGPDDLLPVMRFTGIIIHEEMPGHDGPLAELTFSALFEEEHGVGLLTDGSAILGTGYVHDTFPYESE